MIRHEVDDNLHACMMNPLDKIHEFIHALVHIYCQVWIYIIIISYGVWRPRLSFHHHGCLFGDAVFRVVGGCSMTYDTCQPNMSYPEMFYLVQDRIVDVVELSASVFFNCPICFLGQLSISKQACENLVYDNFLFHGGKKRNGAFDHLAKAP